MVNTKKQPQKHLLLLVMFLTPIIGLGFDLYTPSLPAIMDYYHISRYQANLTIIFYIIGFGVAQPIVGIISDHVSKKYFLLAALAIYFVSSFASAHSHSIHFLYLLRVIGSVCASCVAVIIKNIIYTNFSGKALAKSNNYFTLSWSLTPMLAPVVGGYLQHHFNWQANFYFMGLYSLLGFMLCLCILKENKKTKFSEKTLSFRSVYQKWGILFSDHIFVLSILILSVENAILFIYYTAAPFIIQRTLHFTAAEYGEIMLFAGAAYVFGNICNGFLLNYFSVKKIIALGIFASLFITVFSIMLITVFFKQTVNIYLVTIPVFSLFVFDGLIFSNVMTYALPRYNQYVGTASGLMAGLLNLLSAGMVALCMHWINLHELLTLNIAYFILIMISLLSFALYKEKT